MLFRNHKKNRRRVDAAKKSGELKAAAGRHGPVAFKMFLLLAGSTAVFLGTIEGWKWATSSNQFSLVDVHVSGAQRSTATELLRLGGISLGQNLLQLDVAAVERAISAHPWVESVNVTRRFPSRLSVEVTEHRAVAMLSLGELYLVNSAGKPFKRVKAGDAFDLPLVTGIDRESFSEKRDEGLQALQQAVHWIEAYTGSDAVVKKQALSEINVHSDGVTAVTVDGQEVAFGEGDIQEKLSRLARVRRELRARSMTAEVIHLDNRARPSWVAVQIAAKKP